MKLGLASEERLSRMEQKFNKSEEMVHFFRETSVTA